jgi:hypothetical protein
LRSRCVLPLHLDIAFGEHGVKQLPLRFAVHLLSSILRRLAVLLGASLLRLSAIFNFKSDLNVHVDSPAITFGESFGFLRCIEHAGYAP